MSTRLAALVLTLAALALGVSACGGGGGGAELADDDPATLAPADAPFYLQATLRPTGKAKSNVESLASTISGFDDPFGQLVAYVDQNINDEPTLSGKRISFEKDIEPWVGDKAGLFVDGLTGDPPAAGIIQADDTDAAQQFLDDIKQKGDADRSYKGVDYTVGGEDGTAAGVVGDFLVIGEEAALKDAVDVSEGADPLSDQSRFTDALGDAPEGSIADGYLDVEKVTEAVKANDPESAQGLQASLGDTSGKTALFSLVPNSDSVELDATTDVEQSFTGGDLSALIETFPADSFAAIGVSDLGGLIERTVDQLDQAGIPGVNRESIDQQLAQADLSLDDITGALGDLGIFASGTDQSSLQGAGVVETKDQQLADKLISKLTAITGLIQASGQAGPAPVGHGVSITDPQELGRQPLIITTQGDRIAVGYGEQATRAALAGSGGGTLADDPTYKQAVGALGGNGVSGYVSLARVFKLADALGALDDPDYQKARPYLQHLSYLVFGGGDQGDTASSKVIVGVSR